MSYEGYDVYYCENGHRIGSFDVYDTTPKVCPICGTKKLTFDSVDLTNGCVCDELTEKDKAEGYTCPAHAKELTQVGWTPVECKQCNGTGEYKIVTDWRPAPCKCKGENLACPDCFGTGTTYEVEGEQVIQCPPCKGTGTSHVEVYDIKPLLARFERDEGGF